MSHPDPLFDFDNSYEDDDMSLEHDPSDALLAEYLCSTSGLNIQALGVCGRCTLRL